MWVTITEFSIDPGLLLGGLPHFRRSATQISDLEGNRGVRLLLDIPGCRALAVYYWETESYLATHRRNLAAVAVDLPGANLVRSDSYEIVVDVE